MREKIILWGACDRTQKLLDEIKREKYEIVAIIDNSPEKQGVFLGGIPVYGPDYLNILEYDKVVLCLGEKGEEAVRQQLENGGFDTYKLEKITYFYKRQLIEFYQESKDEEIQKIIEYLRKHSLKVFNYSFTEKYENMEVACYFDENARMWYVRENNRKMYFKRSLDTREKVVQYYRSICEEQDEDSPHRYFANGYDVLKGMTVIDAGVAEGNFAVAVIGKVKKIYLVECDKEWMEALHYTFQNDLDKVVFVEKYLSDRDTVNDITIDRICQNESIDYIKMDIEGEEVRALKGAKKVLERKVVLNICSYHNEGDEKEIKEILSQFEFKIETSKGYMCFLWGKTDENGIHKLTRGLVRARK